MKRRGFVKGLIGAVVSAPAAPAALASTAKALVSQAPPGDGPLTGGYAVGGDIGETAATKAMREQIERQIRLDHANLLRNARKLLRSKKIRPLPRIVREEYAALPWDKRTSVNLSARATYKNMTSLRRYKFHYQWHIQEVMQAKDVLAMHFNKMQGGYSIPHLDRPWVREGVQKALNNSALSDIVRRGMSVRNKIARDTMDNAALGSVTYRRHLPKSLRPRATLSARPKSIFSGAKILSIK